MSKGNFVCRRRREETIHVFGPCEITILDIIGNSVKVSVKADRDVPILRGELVDAPGEPPAGPGKAA